VSNKRKLRGQDPKRIGPYGKDWEYVGRRDREARATRPDQIKAAVEAEHPGLNDQYDAAVAEALTKFGAAVRGEGDMPVRVQDQVCGLYRRVRVEALVTGKRSHCPHYTMETPCPAVALVSGYWICCRDCYARDRASLPPPPERDRWTCDLCGHYERGQVMTGINTLVGEVMLLLGVCWACDDRITGRARYREAVETAWPDNVWLGGDGPFAAVTFCCIEPGKPMTAVGLHETEAEARRALFALDLATCGDGCTRDHALFEITRDGQTTAMAR
jgi:hypothetical protein